MSVASAAYRATRVVVAVLVLLQAFLAGRFLFGNWSVAAHGVIGNITFAVSVACLATAVLARVGRHAIAVAAVLALLLTVQVGLGYAGRTSGDAAAWHIPMGVLAFGLAIHQLGIAPRRSRYY